MNDIPEWAAKRACDLTNVTGSMFYRPESAVSGCGAIGALARYIAENEQPPVDPLLLEARQVLSDMEPNCIAAESYVAGRCDDYIGMKIALAALRRGIEIGGRQ